MSAGVPLLKTFEIHSYKLQTYLLLLHRDSDLWNYGKKNMLIPIYLIIDSLTKCIPINGEVGHIHVWTCTYRGKRYKTQMSDKVPRDKNRVHLKTGCLHFWLQSVFLLYWIRYKVTVIYQVELLVSNNFWIF